MDRSMLSRFFATWVDWTWRLEIATRAARPDSSWCDRFERSAFATTSRSWRRQAHRHAELWEMTWLLRATWLTRAGRCRR